MSDILRFHIGADIIFVAGSMIALVLFAGNGNMTATLASGFNLLFWQAELHNDFRRLLAAAAGSSKR